MSRPASQMEELRRFLPGARVVPEGGIEYVFLPGLRVSCGSEERVVDALLCPVQHGGYTTRLFLSERLDQRGQNWTPHVIVGRPWHTWSWNNVPSSLPLVQILSAHLRALK